MRDDEQDLSFSEILRRVFVFLGALILAAFLVFGLCTLVVMG